MRRLTQAILTPILGTTCGLLALLTACGPHPAVAGLHTWNDHAGLINTISSLGVEVKMDPAACFGVGSQKLYGGYILDGSMMFICRRGNESERFDTIRHESWHVLQDLQDCDLKDENNLETVFTITTEDIEEFRNDPLRGHLYSEAVMASEAEAFEAAEALTAWQIDQLFEIQIEQCNAVNP